MSFCAFGMLLEKINVFLCLELTGIFCLETFKSDTPRFVYNEILPSSQLFGVFMVSPFFFLSCLLPFCYSQHLAVAVVFSRNFAGTTWRYWTTSQTSFAVCPFRHVL